MLVCVVGFWLLQALFGVVYCVLFDVCWLMLLFLCFLFWSVVYYVLFVVCCVGMRCWLFGVCCLLLCSLLFDEDVRGLLLFLV